jgi:hypothetical protein
MLQSQVGRRPVGEVNLGCPRPPSSLAPAKGAVGDLVDVNMDTSSVNMTVAERAASQVTETPLDLDDMRRGLTLYSPAAGWETTRRTITTTVESTPGYEVTRLRSRAVPDPIVWRRVPTITNGVVFGLGDLLRVLAHREDCRGPLVNDAEGQPAWLNRMPWLYHVNLCPVPPLGKSRIGDAVGLFNYAFRPELLGTRSVDVSILVSVGAVGRRKNEAFGLQMPGYDGVYAGLSFGDDWRRRQQPPIGESMVFAGGGELFPFLGNTGPTLRHGGGFTTVGLTEESESLANDGISPVRDLAGNRRWGKLIGCRSRLDMNLGTTSHAASFAS